MDIKPVLVLAVAFFMASAPNPDAQAVAEMTANFIVPANEVALQASELPLRPEDEIQWNETEVGLADNNNAEELDVQLNES